MMNTNQKIRVIKRGQAKSQRDKATQHNARQNETLRDTTRDVAGHVTAWIKEFQEKRNAKSQRTFASLFVEPATF